MTSKFSRLISETLREYDKFITKHDNYTDTYSKDYLDKFVSVFRDWIMMQHCIEDREAMDQRDKGEELKESHYKFPKVVAEIETTNDGETTIRRIYSNRLEQQIEVDERRTAYEEGLDKHDIH